MKSFCKKKKKFKTGLMTSFILLLVNQFHGCHWHGHTCLKNRTKRQQRRYKDTCQIDWLIKNNGWDTKYNFVSTWECEEPTLKKVWLEKEFTPYLHFIVYDFEAILTPLSILQTI